MRRFVPRLPHLEWDSQEARVITISRNNPPTDQDDRLLITRRLNCPYSVWTIESKVLSVGRIRVE